MKKTISGIMLTLLLIGMLTLAFDIQPVKASGTIYIRADGSVDPDTAPISTVDNVTYAFTDNIYESIVVERDNIVVDGAGYTFYADDDIEWPTISLSGRSNVTIKNMEIIGDEWHCSIVLSESSNNTISGNNIWGEGIRLALFSNGNNIFGNNITWYASIMVSNSSYNSILGNNLAASRGSGIHLYGSSNNSISGNNIKNNSYGIYLDYSSDNLIYHSNFVDNTQQVHSYNSTNVWDDGYPSGGNYWSDYDGTDLYSGPYQNETGSDGIGDTPYLIAAGIRDNYPLMSRFPWEFDVAITNVSPSETVVPHGCLLSVNVTVENQGWSLSPVTFNLTVKGAYTYIPRAQMFQLQASATHGWNYSIPGPTIIAYLRDTVVLTLEGVDNLHHKFYVDYDANAFPDSDEPQSPSFINTTLTFNFTASTPGNFTYYCAYHQDTMFGSLIVNPDGWSTQIGSQNVTLSYDEKKNVIFTWNTTGFAKGNYTITAYAKPVPGEMDTIDNTYTDGIVRVARAHDIAVTNVAPSKTIVGQNYLLSINATVENQGDYTETFNVTAFASSAVSDDFNDNSTDFAVWKTFEKNDGTVSETNGRVECSVPAPSPPGGGPASGYITKKSYDVSSCDIRVDVSNLHLCEVALALTLDGLSDHFWYSNNFYAIQKHNYDDTCKVRKRIDGGDRTTLYDEPWTGSTGSLRITIQDGTISFYEEDNLRYSEPFGLSSYNCYVHVQGHTWGEYFGTDYFDNFSFLGNKPIDTKEVTVTSRNSATIIFTWNTTGFAKGNYTISANATIVPLETDTGDNSCIDGTVRVNMVGDVAPEFGKVNIVDLVYVAIHFDAKKGEPKYEPNADINDDGRINIIDIVIVAIHWTE